MRGCPSCGTVKCCYNPRAYDQRNCLFCISLRLFGVYNLAAGAFDFSKKGISAVIELWGTIQGSLVGGSQSDQGVGNSQVAHSKRKLVGDGRL